PSTARIAKISGALIGAGSRDGDRRRPDHVVVVTGRVEDQCIDLGLADTIGRLGRNSVRPGGFWSEPVAPGAKAEAAIFRRKAGRAPSPAIVGGYFDQPNSIAAVPRNAVNVDRLAGCKALALDG